MNQKILDYRIVSTEDLSQAEALVREYIQRGYQPYGHLMPNGGPAGNTRWIQVMVKYETFADLVGNAAKNAESFFK